VESEGRGKILDVLVEGVERGIVGVVRGEGGKHYFEVFTFKEQRGRKGRRELLLRRRGEVEMKDEGEIG